MFVQRFDKVGGLLSCFDRVSVFGLYVNSCRTGAPFANKSNKFVIVFLPISNTTELRINTIIHQHGNFTRS